MFRFENIEYIYVLLLIPVLIAVFWFIRQQRNRTMRKFGEPQLLERLFPDISKYKPAIKFALVLTAFAFIILGVANPQIGSRLVQAKREGVDVVIVLDVSNSMKSEDVRPDRLERAKRAVSQLIDKLQNDRIGIIVFAGEAFVQLPLTTDYSAAKLFLNTVDTDIMPVQGTAIGAALELAEKSFKIESGRRKAIILITDGENHEDDAVGAARSLAKKGFIIHTIGIGSVNGGPIPIYSNGNKTGYMKDDEGNVIMTKLDADMLKQIAAAGNGKFIRAADSDPDLPALINEIGKMEKREYESKLYTDYEDRFQYPLVAALLLLIAEIFFTEKKNRMITSLNLFAEGKK